jgi:hypothetical protein
MSTAVQPIDKRERIILRDQLSSDADRFVYRQTHGEWLAFAAPQEDETMRAKFLERCWAKKPTPRRGAAIVLHQNSRPLGWVSGCTKDGYQEVVSVGFVLEGPECELRQWQGQWLDLVD